jgi:hypothetical protein
MTAAVGDVRRQTIAETISSELDRQARAGAFRIDIDAMAAAIDRAVGRSRSAMPGMMQMRQAKRPDQLNATNDG